MPVVFYSKTYPPGRLRVKRDIYGEKILLEMINEMICLAGHQSCFHKAGGYSPAATKFSISFLTVGASSL